MKLAFATDIHLNFANTIAMESFANQVLATKPDALVISGDISEAPDIQDHLRVLEQYFDKYFPTYFVLGNHDYYHGSIKEVRASMKKYCALNTKSPTKAVWLGSKPFIRLTDKTALVGHDGWYDGQYSDWFASRLWMSDYDIIDELSMDESGNPRGKTSLYAKINELAFQSAKHVSNGAQAAIKAGHTSIVIATHVPPFPENSVYNGKQSDSTWLPCFSSKNMGDALLKLAKANQDVSFLVLCGHSHGQAKFQPVGNLTCITGKAQYNHPSLAGTFDLE